MLAEGFLCFQQNWKRERGWLVEPKLLTLQRTRTSLGKVTNGQRPAYFHFCALAYCHPIMCMTKLVCCPAVLPAEQWVEQIAHGTGDERRERRRGRKPAEALGPVDLHCIRLLLTYSVLLRLSLFSFLSLRFTEGGESSAPRPLES